MTIRPSRRGILNLGAALAGSFVLGFELTRDTASAAPAVLQPNAFLRLDPNGRVVLILPKAEMGQGVYTAIAMLVAEELEVDLNQIDVELPDAQPRRFGDLSQITGGSSSVRDTWVVVRTAGAAARMMLVEAAAQQWGVRSDQCEARGGRVLHPATSRSVAYTELLVQAGQLPAPRDVALKTDGFRILGMPARRLDAPHKVTGAAVYGIDVRLPGLKVATFMSSPVIGGFLKNYDADAALRVPGVRQVVPLEDAIAIVGDHMWAAKRGLEALGSEWGAGDHVDLEQAGIVADLVKASERPGGVAARHGDVAGAMAEAGRTVQAVYHQPFLAHLAMEPLNCTVDLRHNACEVWTGTQAPGAAIAAVAAVTGLPETSITIHTCLLGGAFGRRLEVDMVERAVRIAKAVKGPVKVVWSREQDIRSDRLRPYYVDRIEAGLGKDDLPVAWSHRIAGSSIMARLYPSTFSGGVDLDAVEGAVETPYAVPNSQVEFVRQESPLVTSWWRGVGPLRSIFVVESFIDELAHAAGQDPVDYRRRLVRSPRTRAVLDKAVAMSGWGEQMPAGRGRGVSLLSAWGTVMAQVAEVEVSGTEVKIRRVTCAIDCGQVVNPLGVVAQVEGGVTFGASAVLTGEITIAGGSVMQSNFHDHPVIRMTEAPHVDTYIMPSDAAPGGVGEPPTAGAAPAIVNAVFAATGKRVRVLPLARGLAALA